MGFTLALLLARFGAAAAIPSDVLLESLKPQGRLNDFAGLLSAQQRGTLDQVLSDLETKTTAQLAVVTLDSLQGGQVDDFTQKLFQRWGVGQKGKDNGVMLLVAVKDRKARIEVGYGLEPVLPDALAGRVLDDELFPAFREQRYADGLIAAARKIASIVERGEPYRPPSGGGGGPSFGDFVFYVLFLGGILSIGSYLAGGYLGARLFWRLPCGCLLGGGALLVIAGIAKLLSLQFAGAALLGAYLARAGFRSGRKDPKEWREPKVTHSGSSRGWLGGRSRGGFSSGGGGGFGGGRSGGGGASGGW